MTSTHTAIMRNKTVAALFALFLGTLGMHKFYLGKKNAGLVYLICTIAGWLTYWLIIGLIPIMVITILSFIDAIKLLLMDSEDFNVVYNTQALRR